MLALLATTVVVLSLTLFAFQTKWDITGCGSILFVALMLLIMVSFAMMFMEKTTGGELLISYIGAFLFSLYLICKYIVRYSQPNFHCYLS